MREIDGAVCYIVIILKCTDFGALVSVICHIILEEAQWNNLKLSATNEHGGDPHHKEYYIS
jgi:hypothetical protein